MAVRGMMESYDDLQQGTAYPQWAEVLGIKKLFDRVAPDECSWTLDKGTLVIAMEKVEPKAWADLALPGSD